MRFLRARTILAIKGLIVQKKKKTRTNDTEIDFKLICWAFGAFNPSPPNPTTASLDFKQMWKRRPTFTSQYVVGLYELEIIYILSFTLNHRKK
jgi:hypothetical protein